MSKLIIGVTSLAKSLHEHCTRDSVLQKNKLRFLVFVTLLVVLIYACFLRLNGLNLHIFSNSSSHTHNVEEVYATLLCPPTPHPTLKGEIDYYFEATRILAYRLLHKSSTKDLHNRRFIVLATEGVLPEQIRQLQLDGAFVRTVSAMLPPKGVDRTKIKERWKDQFTKLKLWNMTEYSKVLYIDADILPIRPLSAVFDTPLTIDKEGHPYLFASVYDSAQARGFGSYSRPVPVLGPNDTHGGPVFNAGMFLIHPSHRQANYVQSIYDNVPKGEDFTGSMEQGFLRYVYRDNGGYPWTRLSQIYNTQWPRLKDSNVSHALHDKMWRDNSPVAWDLRRFWYFAWGEMQGWSDERQRSKKWRQ